MSGIEYRIRGDTLSHAFLNLKRKTKYADTKTIIGREPRGGTTKTSNPYGPRSGGTYASKYYDPVKRHEYYEAHKTGGSSRRSGGSGKAKAKAKKGGKSNVSKQIAELRNASALETAAQREAAQMQINDLTNALRNRISELRQTAYGAKDSQKNTAELRGIIQNLRKEINDAKNGTSEDIQKIQADLSTWITNEQTRVAKRVAELQHKKYNDGKSEQKTENTSVTSRAQVIYKQKTGKK